MICHAFLARHQHVSGPAFAIILEVFHFLRVDGKIAFYSYHFLCPKLVFSL